VFSGSPNGLASSGSAHPDSVLPGCRWAGMIGGMRVLPLALLGLLLGLTTGGCNQSEYAQSFHSSMGMPPPALTEYRNMNLVAFAGRPRIIASTLTPEEQIQYLEEGWVSLGESSFYGPLESDGALTDQARKVGAEVVLLSRVLGQRVQGATPYTTYEPVSVYRFGGRRATRVETAYVPQTSYMPYAENWYAQRAIYYTHRIEPPAFGALPRELNVDDRKRLGFNAGVAVICCVRNTPAWNAGILPDDVIVNVAGVQIGGPDDLRNAVLQNAGKTVSVQYLRGGEKRTVSVTLGASNSGE